jgi:O-succinylbenzoic acid--CoA ligase
MRELVALALPGGPQFVDELRRAWDRGDAVLPVDPRLPAPAVQALFDALAPSAVIAGAGAGAAARGGAGSGAAAAGPGAGLGGGVAAPGAGSGGAATQTALDGGRPVEDGDALVIATSGTTGVPKGVVLTHAAVAASAVATSSRLGVDPDRHHWLACLPLAHIGGLSVVLRALHLGTRLTVHDGFDAAEVMASARARARARARGGRGPTHVSLVPTALARLDPSAFECILLGGAAPPSGLPANVRCTYGMTETGSAVVYDGRPLDGVEVREVDGELWVRGPMLLRGYRDGTDPRTPDGWLPTGDGGSVDADTGFVRVFGRRGDVIVTGAEKVWPDPVERVLLRVAGVAEVAVVGRPDPEWGQLVTAVIVPSDPASPPSLDALRDAVKGELAPYCAPRRLELVEGLPRTALGKVRRSAL